MLLGLGNPAASLEMQKYLKASTKEQLRAHITPKQAVPLFLSKLLLLASYMNRKIAVGQPIRSIRIGARPGLFQSIIF